MRRCGISQAQRQRMPGLAGVLEELGDSEGSLESLREALRHDPRHAGALARLATRLRGTL